MSRPVKRSLTLRGHRTSVSLEDEFWDAFRDIAEQQNKPLNVLAAEIDEDRGTQTGLAGNVQWFPTELTTANFFASQSVSDAGSTADSSALVTRYGVGADHELLRTLVLSSSLYFENREFNPSNREDDQTVFSAGANWKLNPNVQISGNYRFATQDSSVNPFDDHSVTIAVRFFP